MIKQSAIVKLMAIALILPVVLASGCVQESNIGSGNGETSDNSQLQYSGKKVYMINSYHEGYAWSDAIESAIRSIFNGTGIELKIFRMDSKNNPDEDFIIQKALAVKDEIESFNPDVIISSDDNAFKYVIMEYYRDSEIPVVFCGLNWDASIYEAPYSNTAGMVEVALIPELIGYLKEYSEGDRIGFLDVDVATARKEGKYYKEMFGLEFTEKYATSFEEWKSEFISLQTEVDMIIVGNNAGLTDWDHDEIKSVAETETKIPTGTIYDWMMDYSLIGLTKVSEEQGEWSANAALRIIDGENPQQVGVTTNQKGNLMLNLNIADILSVDFSSSMIKNAEKIIE